MTNQDRIDNFRRLLARDRTAAIGRLAERIYKGHDDADFLEFWIKLNSRPGEWSFIHTWTDDQIVNCMADTEGWNIREH